MSANIPGMSHRLPNAFPQGAPPRSRFSALWALILQTADAAVRHHYAAPWLTDAVR